MKKVFLLLVSLVLLSGCTITRMDTKTYDEVIDKVLSLNIKLSNKVGKGYKYYAPRGVVRVDANTYNDVLKRDSTTYYLYVDVVSYYYKTKFSYKNSKNDYYFKTLKNGKKDGYVDIVKKNNKFYVQMVYNYAKIEAYVDKDNLKKSVEDMSYILSSVKFNDTLLKKMHEQGTFGSKEEAYKLFDNKEKEGNFLEYVKEYDKYDGDESSVTKEEEIKVKDKTTTTTTKKQDEEKTKKEDVTTMGSASESN